MAAERGGYGTEFDLQTYFLHDLLEGVLRSGPAHLLGPMSGALRTID